MNDYKCYQEHSMADDEPASITKTKKKGNGDPWHLTRCAQSYMFLWSHELAILICSTFSTAVIHTHF